MKSQKITPEHLRRSAVVYVRQSSPTQLRENLESRRLQYALVDTAREMGFANVETIDEDLGKSASGLVERPGFARLVAMVCRGIVGAVFCIEASRLARNGRDWHSLIELCALCGTLLVDPESAYDPRSMNDRLLLGLKGTMSEYELGLLHQRAQAARNAKARRGELRFILPAGYCWDELGRIEIDADARVAEAVRLVFRKFTELHSARQVFLWLRERKIELLSTTKRNDGNRASLGRERRWSGISIAVREQGSRNPSKNVNSPKAPKERTAGRGGSLVPNEVHDRPPRPRTAPRDRQGGIVRPRCRRAEHVHRIS